MGDCMGTNADKDLTIEQRTAVNKVRKASDEYRVARDTLERQLREELTQRLGQLQAIRDNDVRVAFAMGVRKATLKRAIGSKDHNTLQHILTMGGIIGGMPDSEMVSWTGVDTFTVNFVDYLGERVYGKLYCQVVYTDDVVTGFDVIGGEEHDELRVLLERTTLNNNFDVYQVIVDALG
jgi:hypothetical protein